MAKPLTEEDVQRVAALVVSLQEALEDSEQVDLWTQLVEMQDSMASAVATTRSVQGALPLEVSKTIASQLTEIHSQLIALTKEPSNSVQFFYHCKHLTEVLPELGIRQETPLRRITRFRCNMFGSRTCRCLSIALVMLLKRHCKGPRHACRTFSLSWNWMGENTHYRIRESPRRAAQPGAIRRCYSAVASNHI